MSKLAVDIVVPTIPGRENSLARCLKSYEILYPKWAHYELHVVENSTSSGEGWLKGSQECSGDYIHFTNDDLEVMNEDWLEAAVEACDNECIPAPYVWEPDGWEDDDEVVEELKWKLQSAGGGMRMTENLNKQMVDDWTVVDFTTVPFMSRKQYENIGMIPVHYCSDVWVSYYGRQEFGYETVVRRDYEFRHYNHKVGRGAGMDQNMRAALDRSKMNQYLDGSLDLPVRHPQAGSAGSGEAA